MSTANTTLLSRRQVCKITSISQASIYRMMSAGKFPRPVKIAGMAKRKAWRSEEIKAFIATCTEK